MSKTKPESAPSISGGREPTERKEPSTIGRDLHEILGLRPSTEGTGRRKTPRSSRNLSAKANCAGGTKSAHTCGLTRNATTKRTAYGYSSRPKSTPCHTQKFGKRFPETIAKIIPTATVRRIRRRVPEGRQGCEARMLRILKSTPSFGNGDSDRPSAASTAKRFSALGVFKLTTFCRFPKVASTRSRTSANAALIATRARGPSRSTASASTANGF